MSSLLLMWIYALMDAAALTVDWRVRPIVTVVKEWAKRRDMNDANRSTFTSYSLVLMVIHYFQCKFFICSHGEFSISLEALFSENFAYLTFTLDLQYECFLNGSRCLNSL